MIALLLALAITNPSQITYTADGGVQRSLAVKLSDVVSVKDFGAKGDGTTDDTVAVVSAVAAAGDITRVLFPCPGTYKTTDRGTLACGQGTALDWATATTPYLIAHRGSLNIGAPENTIPAFDFASGFGENIVLETDVQMTADGALVLMHDPSADRTAGSTGSIPISNLMLDQLRALDASTIYNPSSVFTSTRIPLFEDWLRRYGGKHLLIPEVKDERSVTGTAMAKMIFKYGLQRSVIVQCFSTNALVAVKAVDPSIKTVLTSGPQISPSTALAAGVWAVYIDRQNIDAPYVASIHAVGIRVFSFNNGGLVYQLEKGAALGEDGITSDDPGVLLQVNAFTPRSTAPNQPTIAVPYSFIGSGWRPRTAGNANSWTPAIVGGFLSWSGMGTIAGGDFTGYTIPGMRPSAALATTQTITTTLKAVATPTVPDTSRWMGFRLCFGDDAATDWFANSGFDANGYVFAYRQNGSAELNKVVNDVSTLLGSATWNTYAAGGSFPITIAITATTITITRTDTSQTLAVTNSVFARTGFISVIGSGVVPGLGATALTY